MERKQVNPEAITVSREKAKHYFLKIGLGVLVLTLVTTALQYAAAYFFAYNFPNIYNTWWFSWILSTVPLYCVTFPLMLLVLPKPVEKIGERRPFGVGKLIAACVISVSAMYIFNIIGFNIVEYIRILSGGRLGNTDALNSIVNASPTWVTVVIVCIIGPIMEEIIFRKVLIDRVLPFGELRACIFSALVFGIFHGNFRQLLYAAALGFIFSYVYVKTRNIFYSIGMHIGINILGSVAVPKLLSDKNLAAVERAAADPANMTNADTISVLLVFGTVVVGAALIITGVVLFFVFLRKIKFEAPKYEVDGGHTTKMLALNPAVAVSAIVMAAVFALSLL